MFNIAFLKLNKITILLSLLSVLFYVAFAYDLGRTDHIKLLSLYTALFFIFYQLLKFKPNFKFLVVIAFLFRLVFLFATPNLSQDFYRFIWDGRMILEGFNPYLYTPEFIISQLPIAQAQELYAGMGTLNASHYTNYPPIHQLCFVIAGIFSGKSILGSIVVLRVLIIIADFGTFYFGKKLLTRLNIPVNHIFWYILNPFIIIELTGNIHFEGIMIFFLIWSLYLLHINKWKWAALILALSISVKLMPLLFLPLFFKYFRNKTTQKLDIKKLITFYLIIGITTILFFLPFFSLEFVHNYSQTVALWFQNFEFNASLYYIVRAIAYSFRGYNEIVIIGKVLALLVILFVFGLAFFRRNITTKILITNMLFAFTFYLFLSTTIHPWYIATLLILSVFTNYKFPLVWSFSIVLSYLAYATIDTQENFWIIGLEYTLVCSVLIWELLIKKPSKVDGLNPFMQKNIN